MADEDDYAKRLRAVAEVVRSLGMRVQVLRVGDVTVQMSEPWGSGPEPAPAASEEPAMGPEEIRMAKLRDVARRSLGRVPSDDELRALAPALGVA
jgi:hypothetical protein